MHDEMALEDGTALAKPERVGRHEYIWTRTGTRQGSCQVLEDEADGLRLLHVHHDDPKAAWIAAGYLLAVVAHRRKEGWRLLHMDARGAVLER